MLWLPMKRQSSVSKTDEGESLPRVRIPIPPESFNARFRDEFLNGEIFYSLRKAQILIEERRKHYNTKRPHSALGYRHPAH